MDRITKEIYIEELVNILPDAVTYLMQHNIQCIACGEPVWGTLESTAQRKGFTDADIEGFVNDLNALMQNK